MKERRATREEGYRKSKRARKKGEETAREREREGGGQQIDKKGEIKTKKKTFNINYTH